MQREDAQKKLMSTLELSRGKALERLRIILSILDRMLKFDRRPGISAPLNNI